MQQTEGFDTLHANDFPLVSIITVVLNGQRHLECAIRSVLEQSYKNIEYIIIDGGSSDSSIDIIRSFDVAIDFWISEKDRGIYHAMNKGLNYARGELVGILNCDDYYHPESVKTVVQAWLNNKADIVYGDMILRDEKLGMERLLSIDVQSNRASQRLHYVHPTVFVSRKLYDLKRFDERLQIAADYKLMSQFLIEGAGVIKVDCVLATMRRGGVSQRLSFEIPQIDLQLFGVWVAFKSLSKIIFVIVPIKFIGKLLDIFSLRDKVNIIRWRAQGGWRIQSSTCRSVET